MKSDKILAFDRTLKQEYADVSVTERLKYLLMPIEAGDFSHEVIGELDDLARSTKQYTTYKEAEVHILSLHFLGILYHRKAGALKSQFLRPDLPSIGKPLSRKHYMTALRGSIDSFIESSDIGMVTGIHEDYAERARFYLVNIAHEFFDDIFPNIDRKWSFGNKMLKILRPQSDCFGWQRTYSRDQDRIDGFIRLIDSNTESLLAGTYK